MADLARKGDIDINIADETDSTIKAGVTSANRLKVDSVISDGTNEADVSLIDDRNDEMDGTYGVHVVSMPHGRVSDTATSPLRSDAATEALMVVNYAHHEIHEGSHFFVRDFDNSTNDIEILIVTPNTTKCGHFITKFSTDDDIEISFYEGTTTSNNGSSVTVNNNNRNSANTSSITVFTAPTITADGTKLWCRRDRSKSGLAREDSEIILKQNTKYLIRIERIDSGTFWVNWDLIWYEHTSRN